MNKKPLYFVYLFDYGNCGSDEGDNDNSRFLR
jgi:hypothetical protein